MSAPLPGRVAATGADLRKRIQPLPAATRLAALTRQVAGSARIAGARISGAGGLCGVVLAATATRPHLNPAVVVLALIVAVIVWAVRVLLWPFGPCAKCSGSGKNIGSTGKRWGTCRRCKGSGRRQRLGSKLVRRLLSRKKEGSR
jgi:hypothetical protein